MKYFGTDGFRGEANVNLTVEHAFKIGRYVGYKYTNDERHGRIVIGKDTRRSSYMFENALAAGITSSGGDAYLLHVTTTPSVSYVVRSEDFDCGIMISASHNPFHDNGLKLINADGYKMEEEILREIENYIDGDLDLDFKTGGEIGLTIDYFQGRNRYIGYLISTVTRSFKGLRVGLDTANGASFNIAKSVFDALGADTYVISNKPDGLNINVDCGSTHIDNLVKLVKEEKLDVGFAYDGDADRCIAVDNKGQVMDGDAILYICGKHLKNDGELFGNKIVCTVMSNLGLFKAMEKLGVDCEKTKVGDKYVAQCMADNGYILGGEKSGHVIFGKYSQSGDGILTSLRMMEVMLEEKTDFASLHRDFKEYPQLLVNVKVKDKKEVLEDREILDLGERISSELEGNGRLLLRASGTEPLVRVMVEAQTDEICKKKVDQVVDLIRSKGYSI